MKQLSILGAPGVVHKYEIDDTGINNQYFKFYLEKH